MLVRTRTVLLVLGLTIVAALTLLLVYLAWHVLTWILIAALLAAALNPAVEAVERRGFSRGWAATAVFAAVLALIVGAGFLLVPPLVAQVRDFASAVPGYVDDITAGRGPLGFLQEEYHVADRVRAAIEERGPSGVLGLSGPLLGIVRSVISAVVGVVTIVFLTYFMLLEGPRAIRGLLAVVPAARRGRYERVASSIYRTISGYVSGNLLISLIAGTASAIVLFAVGSEFAIALGLLVAIFDLVPLAGATLAAILVSGIVLIETDWIRCAIVVVFFVVYQQVENHLLQPIVYARTVQLSPLAILCSVLIGAQLAGILGALVAIPVAGSLLAVGRELLVTGRATVTDGPA